MQLNALVFAELLFFFVKVNYWNELMCLEQDLYFLIFLGKWEAS